MRINAFKRTLITLALTACAVAQAGTVSVIASFPKELTDTYKKAFETKNPGIKLAILNKSGTASIPYIRETAAGQRPDVFWSSDVVAFEVLARDQLLQKAPEAANPAVPKLIGTYPMSDPEGYYFGQALSGYGMMMNTRYLAANKLPAPKEWADLTKGIYFGHIGISSPSRSGTTHLNVETILQGEGWGKGWVQLLQITGNCAAVTERSFGVYDGVNNGQFGIGIVIDFFGLAARAAGFPVDFVYPGITSVVPASIAMVRGGKNAPEALKFMAYTLSTEGQELLFGPKISRMPVLPHTSLKAPASYPNIYEIARKSKVKFDSEVSEMRYPLVVSLFDQTITFRLRELQAATKAIHAAERKLASKLNANAAELLKQARSFAYTPLVDDKNASNKEFLELSRKNKKDVAVAKQLTGIEELWSSKFKANYARAEDLANQAAALVK